jgi:K+-transporting ATPase ATPase A chain
MRSASTGAGNMEGKEVRFGVALSALFAVDHHRGLLRRGQRHARQLHAARRHDPDVNMQLGEIIVGGVGAGLYGMLLFVVIAVFVAGLMVGRTPEYSARRSRRRR